MQISQTGIDLIKKHEGCRLRAYLCPAGVPTIGYGHTGSDVQLSMVITPAQAEALLATDLITFTDGVVAACAPTLPAQNELDALVSFAYNVGLANLKKSSVLKDFKAGNKDGAAASFMLWTKARDPSTGQLRVLPGLVQRRTEERQLFMQDDGLVERTIADDKITVVPETSVVPEAPKSLGVSKEIIGGVVAGAGAVGQFASSLTSSNVENAKQGTITLQADAKNSAFFTHIHMPEIAAGLTVALSMFIIWKRLTDRQQGVR